MSFSAIDYKVQDGIGILTLNRPEQLNALDIPMRTELGEIVPEIARDESVKVLIFTGAGRAFSAGGDLKALSEGKRPMVSGRERIRKLHMWFPQFVNLEKPVIAAVNGPAFGAGFNMALACDFILASSKARFSQVFERNGLVPDLGGYFLLPRIVGLQKAKNLALSARIISADEAMELGILYAIHEPDALMDAAFALARRLVKAPTAAIGLTKTIMNQAFHLDQRAMVDLEVLAQTMMKNTDYHREAVERFLRKEGHLYDWNKMDEEEAEAAAAE